MSDCPLSAAQSALLWLGLYPWEVVPDEANGYDYAMILERAERPTPDTMHVRDLLERIATNLPQKKSGTMNPATGARVRLALPAPVEAVEDEGQGEGGEEGVDEGEGADEASGGMDTEPNEAEAAEQIAANKAERRRLLKKAILLAQGGRDIEELATALERRMDADMADTFLTAMAAIQPPAAPVAVVPAASVLKAPAGPKAPVDSKASAGSKASTAAARLAAAEVASAALAHQARQAEAEAEMSKFLVADDSGVREKLARTEQRAARERAKVERFLAQRAQRETVQAAAQAAREELLAAQAEVEASKVEASTAEVIALVAGSEAAPKRKRKPKSESNTPTPLVLLPRQA